MGRRRMLGRVGGGSGFRYLHDEVSGGVAAYSHLLTRSAYAGNCMNIGAGGPATDYGFDASNFADLTQVDSDFGSDQPVNTQYDQIGSNNLDTGPNNMWIKSVNEFTDHDGGVGLNNVSTSGALASLSGAMTVVQVIKHNAVARTTNEYLLTNSLGYRFRLGYGITTQFVAMHCAGSTANRIEKRYNSGDGFPFDNDLHLIIETYDGSETSAGIEVYADNVVTPVAESSSADVGIYTNTAPFHLNIFQGFLGAVTGSDFQGFIYETHVFSGVKDQSERETIKEILEQYYTFS